MSAAGQGGGWMTIPEWGTVRQVDVFRREQDNSPMAETGAPENLHVLVRGRVELPPGDYTLRISTDDYYHAWLDGAWLGQGPAPAYHDHYFYQEYPVEGGRTVTLALHLYYQGLVNRVWNSGDGRFALWAEFVRDGGAIARCDESWRYEICTAYSGDTIGYVTQFLENFDSRLWPEGWERPGFDDSAWGHLVPALWADYRLSRQPTESLWRGRVEAVSRRPVPGGVLLDFGRERVGTLHAAARGRAGQRLTLRFGEELDGRGRVRYELRCNCHYEETWTLAEGESTLHQFDYKAFRYVEVLGLEVGPVLTQCWVWERHYPMDDGLCTLSCEQDQLEDIFQICKNAVRCAAQEAFLDCPSREKGQYLGDAVITARSQVWLTGRTDLLRKCIRDFMASARVTPSLMAVAPGALMQEIADFSLLFPALPLTDYEFTGDRDFLRECFPTVEGIGAYFARYRRPDGLLENVSHGWNLVDWPEGLRDGYDFPLTRPVVGEGCHNVVNALWYGFLRMKERMERILGLPRTDESRRVGAAFRGAFWRQSQSLFADSEASAHCSLHANLYPACFGLTPPEGADVYEALLLTTGRVCGVLPMYFALRGLGRLGKYDTLYRLLTREDKYGWRNMLAEGATACFEAWGKDQKWNTSLCHPWASGPIPLIIEELAGLRPDPDRAEGFRFEPRLPDKVDHFTLQAPFRGRLLRVERKKRADRADGAVHGRNDERGMKMLYPKLNEARMLIDLGGVWDFQTAGAEEWPEAWAAGPLERPLTMAVPASYNDQKDDVNLRAHYGWAVYQRTFTLPRSMTGERVVLRFGAVTHAAQVYLNGHKLGEHKGGFLPFEFEVDEYLTPGGNRLTVAVDNRVNYSTLPVGNENTVAFFGSDNPGVPSIELAKTRCRPQNKPNFDFFNYAGIIRPVRLYTTPRAYIKDISIITDIDGADGIVDYDVETVGQGGVSVSILDEQGVEVARCEGGQGRVTIPNARLWNPGAAYLYRARVTFWDDVYEQTFGVRTVKVEGTKFLINGKPFYFKGFGKHEDSFFRGRGMDECLNVKDLSMIRWLGANSFRTSHYPYAEEMYDLCDREGVVVIDETPAVGVNAGGAENPYEVMRIHEHHRDVIREMIRRDKNHPCVVMWSIANEPDTEHFPQSAYDYFHPLYELAHACDPQGRPVTLVACQNDYTKDIITRAMDVCCVNRYYGWYNLSGDLDAACDAWNTELDFWAEIGKPLMLTEYGADTYPGVHNTNGEMFSEEYQLDYYSRINAELDKRPFFIGEQVWNFADFATIQGPMRVDGNKKGLLTRDRRPKLAAHYFRKRWHGIPDFGYKG